MRYRKSDGSFLFTSTQALLCGKPIIMYYDEEIVKECFGSLPPIFNAYRVDEIYDKMGLCADPEMRQKYGTQIENGLKTPRPLNSC